MSTAFNNKKKEKKAKRTAEQKSVTRKIRTGELPRYYFKRLKDTDGPLDRKASPRPGRRGGLTFTLLGTYKKLTAN